MIRLVIGSVSNLPAACAFAASSAARPASRDYPLSLQLEADLFSISFGAYNVPARD